MLSKYKTAEGGSRILETYDELVKAWGVETAESNVHTPYGGTHLIIAGDPANPPLVLFHGVGDDSALMWLLNAKALSERFRVFAVDTMGGPGKSEPNEDYSKSFDQVKWIDSILDAQALDQVYLAGVSNGAYLAQLYAVKRPGRVIRAVCMAGSIAVKGAKSPMWRMMKVFLPEALFPSEKNALRLVTKLSGDPAAIGSIIKSHPVFLKHYVHLLKHFNNQSMFPHRITWFNDDEIAGIREKTRFLIGSCDRLVCHSDALASLDKYGLNYRIVEGVGHALNMEQPELIYRELTGFLLG